MKEYAFVRDRAKGVVGASLVHNALNESGFSGQVDAVTVIGRTDPIVVLVRCNEDLGVEAKQSVADLVESLAFVN